MYINTRRIKRKKKRETEIQKHTKFPSSRKLQKASKKKPIKQQQHCCRANRRNCVPVEFVTNVYFFYVAVIFHSTAVWIWINYPTQDEQLWGGNCGGKGA